MRSKRELMREMLEMQSLNPQNLTINFPIIAAPKRTINGFA